MKTIYRKSINEEANDDKNKTAYMCTKHLKKCELTISFCSFSPFIDNFKFVLIIIFYNRAINNH